MGFFELDIIDWGWGAHHKVDTVAVLREVGNVADVVFIFENHEDTVEAWSTTSVRWSAKLEGVKHAAEAVFDVGMVVAEDFKYAIHDFWVVITDGARSNFVAVHNHVILVSNNSKFLLVGLGVFERSETALWHAKWVVAKVELIVFAIPFVERQIDDPTKRNEVWIFAAKVVGKSDTKLAENFVYKRALICTEEDGITIFGTGAFFDGGDFGLAHKLEDWRLSFAILVKDVGEATGTEFFGFFGEVVNFK